MAGVIRSVGVRPGEGSVQLNAGDSVSVTETVTFDEGELVDAERGPVYVVSAEGDVTVYPDAWRP